MIAKLGPISDAIHALGEERRAKLDRQEAEENLRKRIVELKLSAFDRLFLLARGSINPKTVGYASLEDAARKITLKTQGEVEKTLRAFERKYPIG